MALSENTLFAAPISECGMRIILCWMTAALLLRSATAMADGDLGHKILGAVGLDAGTQPDEGVYVGDRFIYFSADQLRNRRGGLVPVKGLDIDAHANVLGVSATLKPEGAPYLSAALAVPVAWVSTKADVPSADIDRFGLGDIFVEPLKLGWRLPHLDTVASYSFYAPTGQADRKGIGRPQWSQQFSLGGTLFFDDERAFRLSFLASYNLYHQKIGIDVTRGDTVQLQGDLEGDGSKFWMPASWAMLSGRSPMIAGLIFRWHSAVHASAFLASAPKSVSRYRRFGRGLQHGMNGISVPSRDPRDRFWWWVYRSSPGVRRDTISAAWEQAPETDPDRHVGRQERFRFGCKDQLQTMDVRVGIRAFSSRSYCKTGLADVVAAFGSGEWIQAFVGRQSPADEPIGPTAPSGRAASALPARPFPG